MSAVVVTAGILSFTWSPALAGSLRAPPRSLRVPSRTLARHVSFAIRLVTFPALLIAFLLAAAGFFGASALELVVRDGAVVVAFGFFVCGVVLFAMGLTPVLTLALFAAAFALAMAGWRRLDPLVLVDAALAVLVGWLR